MVLDMANFKNIRIKMKGGKSRTQRVKVLASGKYKFVKNIGRKLTSRTRKASPTRRKGVRRMTRRKKRSGGKSISRTAFKWIRIGALVAPAAIEFVLGADTPTGKALTLVRKYTGWDHYNKRMDWGSLLEGWGPYLGAVLTTYGIPKLVSIIRRL